MAGRIMDGDGAGDSRGGSPFQDTSATAEQRGGNGSGFQSSDAATKNVHSSYGFRRALKNAAHKSNRLASQLPSKSDQSGPNYSKPNYFAQGGKRHGMHIGSGAPFTGGAAHETSSSSE